MSALSPAKGPPQRVVLEGRYVRLEPIGPQHVVALWQSVVPERYIYLLSNAPSSQSDLADWVATVATQTDPLYFAVVDKMTGLAEGQQCLMRIVPEHGVIEIGGIYRGPNMARTPKATEALFLHAQYVFDTLGYRRFEWKCNNHNEPSKVAAQRFGFQYEGLFRQHMIQKGQNRDTAWFAMTDGDWPAIRTEYERWLAPDNFDAAGQQRTKLQFV